MGLFSPSRSMKDFALLDRVKVVLHVHMVLYSLNIPIVMMYNLPNSKYQSHRKKYHQHIYNASRIKNKNTNFDVCLFIVIIFFNLFT
ncbi:hypothetical protein PPACK8108_LOCUS18413 [Phakopsora pachyrhizi]|uniref:Uncharacterized protein n=1 Tax=Phakopsora pachyrhizi TaxID=170000 RepID=A0AAV0BAS4_PHAPC|nr:hypothetical protein PPACK8108_LOCUS18413 [Phakopsora pachyrhizi]